MLTLWCRGCRASWNDEGLLALASVYMSKSSLQCPRRSATPAGVFLLPHAPRGFDEKLGVVGPALYKPGPITAVRGDAREVTSESCSEFKAQAGERLVSTRPGDQRCFIKAPVPVAPQALKNDLRQRVG